MSVKCYGSTAVSKTVSRGSTPCTGAKFGVEASMVMQWTVNPPPNGTPGSIPGYSTKYVAVRRMVRQQSAKLYNVGSSPIRHSNMVDIF